MLNNNTNSLNKELKMKSKIH